MTINSGSHFIYLLRQYVFWLLFFCFFRMLFFIQLVLNNIHFTISEIINTITHAIRLDFSAASYAAAFPFLLLTIYQFTGARVFQKAIKIYHYIIIPVCTVLLIANIKIYESWGTILNRRAITFAADPREIMASLSFLQLFLSLGFFALITGVTIYFFKQFVGRHFPIQLAIFWKKVFIVIVSSGIIFLGIRGGWQLIPINESAAYFSPRTVLNHVSTNPLWHLANNLSKSKLNDHNPFQGMSDDYAKRVISGLYNSGKSNTVEILNHGSKPNIVLIMLESWTADIIAPLHGDINVTPFFSSLCDSGLLFSNIYATGRRTDQAFPSLLSGFPAQPDHSIIRFTDKTEQLPYLSHYFKSQGYNLSFYYGGELGFANMQSYLLYGGFQHLVGKDDFPSGSMNSKWGAHDEFVLDRQLTELNNTPEPFFSMLVTLSSHEPYEIPRPDYIKGKDIPSNFRNAARYTDECLKEYFTKAKQQPWYKNTLFILVADHGHIQPRNRDYYDMLTHRIPLLFYGPALLSSLAGKQINNIGNQNDLAATLLNQFKFNAQQFSWSNDLMNTTRNNFAYADFDESLGWVNDSGSFIYNNATGKIDFINGNQPDSISINQAKAYRQLLYQSFIDLGNK